MEIGLKIYKLVEKLFPICRSITGNGTRETLRLINSHLIDMKIIEIPSGTKCFDWDVPDEWNITDGYILDPDNKKIVDFQESNLHVVSYSEPVNQELSLEELQDHLYSLPDLPEAIPYITSYYKKRWGFCLSENLRKSLISGTYKVKIDSTLKKGFLTYGELFIPGKSKKEILLSTYVCHPSMANNELSGPCVATYLAKWLKSLRYRKYSYRFVFVPETIGSILYLSRNIDHLKSNVVAGFNLTCLGDNREYSFLPSRMGDTLSDQVAKHVLKNRVDNFIEYSFNDRGSDERQYCSPGIDLPIASVMRSKYGEYPEYHTSLDNLDLVTPEGLEGGYNIIKACLECIENNEKLQLTTLAEPQLGKRGLYPNLSSLKSRSMLDATMALLAYCDGNHSLLDIANKCNLDMMELVSLAEKFKKENLLTEVE